MAPLYNYRIFTLDSTSRYPTDVYTSVFIEALFTQANLQNQLHHVVCKILINVNAYNVRLH